MGPVLASLQEEGGIGGPALLVGGIVVGTGVIDLLLAFFLGFVRPPANADARTRRILVLAIAAGGLLLCGLGAAILAGLIPVGG
jgi:hypothetical protein